MFENPAGVMEYTEKEKVEFVDIRFADLSGRWQHFTMPIDGFEEDAFESGLGFDGSSIQGFQSIQASDLLLLPDATSAFVDPFAADKTLVLIADVKSPQTGDSYSKDPRRVAKQAELYLRESGIADTINMGPEAEFFIFDSVAFSTDPYSYGFRFQAADAHTDGDAFGDGYYIKNKGGYFPCPPSDKFQDLRYASEAEKRP